MAQEYNIQAITEADVEPVMSLLRRTFYIDEPMTAALGLCENNASCEELDEYCKHSILGGLSFTAVDKEGNIAGVIISGIYPLKEEDENKTLLTQAKSCKNPKFQKILYVLAQREEGARLWEKYPEEKNLVDVMVAATDPKWRRRGIMNKLLSETEKAVIARGIKLLRMDTSSYYSALSAESHGFTCVYKANYVDIKKDGEPLVVPAPPHVSDRVYIKELIPSKI